MAAILVYAGSAVLDSAGVVTGIRRVDSELPQSAAGKCEHPDLEPGVLDGCRDDLGSACCECSVGGERLWRWAAEGNYEGRGRDEATVRADWVTKALHTNDHFCCKYTQR